MLLASSRVSSNLAAMSDGLDRKTHEEAFVAVFIQRHHRERLLFELASRRGRFLSRFCHAALHYLDPRYVVTINPPNSDPDEILAILKKHGAGKDCYAMSCNDDIDTRIFPLKEALPAAVGHGLPSILSCLPGKLAYLETEQDFGPPPRYLLYRKHA